MNRKNITVFGATGEQGSSVVAALQKNGNFNIRATTRNASSAAAQNLAASGIEVVEADQTNPASVKAAFSGTYGAFVVTNYWDPSTMGKEEMLGISIADAAKEAGVQVFIWCGLPNVEKLTGGKYTMEHFSGKARVWEHARSLGFVSAISVEGAFFFSSFGRFSDNFGDIMGAQKSAEGQISFKMPVFKGTDLMAGFNAAEIGKIVTAVLLQPQKFDKKRIQFATVYNQPLSQWVSELAAFTGKTVTLTTVPYETAKAKHAYAADIFASQSENGYYPAEEDANIMEASDVVGKSQLSSWPQWLASSRWALDLKSA